MNLSLPKLQAVNKKEWLTIIGAAAVLIAIPLTVILLRRYQETRIWALEAGQVVDGSVKVTNIHAHGFTVSWATVGDSTGVLQWGPAGQPLAQVSHDDRAGDAGPNFSSSTHYVTLPYPPGYDREHPLFREPGQAYDFRIFSGDGKLYGGIFDGLFTVEGVTADASPVTVITGPELVSEPLYTSKSLVAPLFVRRWPSGKTGYTQWSVFTLANNTNQDAVATLSFVGKDRSGNPVTLTEEKTVAANNYYNLHGDTNLQNRLDSFDGLSGYVEISSTQPLFGMLRHLLTEDGSQPPSSLDPLGLVADTPLPSEHLVSSKLVVPLFVRHGIPQIEGHSYWSALILTNTGGTQANFTVRFYGQDRAGQTVNHTLGPKVLAPHESYNTYSTPADTSPLGDFSGFAVIESDQPLIGYTRDIWVRGEEQYGEVEKFTDNLALPDQSPFVSENLTAPLFVRRWPSGKTGYTQWSVFTLANNTNQDAVATLSFVGKDRNGASATLTVEKTVASNSQYNLHSDSDLEARLGNFDGFSGYVEISSTQPLFGMLRHLLTEDGSQPPSSHDPLDLVSDSLLLSDHFSSTNMVAPVFVRHWRPQIEGHSYWSALILTNTGGTQANFTVRFYGQDRAGQTVNHTLGPKVLAPHESYNTYSTPADTSPLGDFSGFAVIESDQPLIGYTRDIWVRGEEQYGELVIMVDRGVVYNREGMDQEIRCHFSTPLQPDLTPTEAIAPGCPDPVFGEVQKSEGTAAPGTIVYVYVYNGDAEGTQGRAMPLSAITNDSGRYVIDLGNSRTTDLAEYFAYNRDLEKTDAEDIYAEGGVDGSAYLSGNPTSNDQPIPTLILNHPPVVEIPDQEISEGMPYEYQVDAFDADGDQLTYALTCPPRDIPCTPGPYAPPDGMTIDPDTGVISWPSPGPVGSSYNLIVWVDDGKSNGLVREDYTLTVTAAPDTTPPDTIIVSGPAEGSVITYNDVAFVVSGTDNVTAPENLVFSWKIDDRDWTVFVDTPNIMLANLSVGSHTFLVKAKDEAGNEDPTPAQRLFTVAAPLSCANAVSPATFEPAPDEEQVLTATPTGGSGSYSYSWSASGGSFVGGTTSANATWKAPTDAADGAQYTITVDVSDTQTGESCSGSSAATISVPSPELDHVTIYPPLANLVVGDVQPFEAKAYDSGGSEITSGVTYTWEIPWMRDGDIGTITPNPSDDSRATFTATKAGSNVARVVATLGANSVDKVAPINVYEKRLVCEDTVVSRVSPPSFTIEPEGTKPLEAIVVGGSGSYSYLWTVAKGTFPGGNDTRTVTWKAPAKADVADGETIIIWVRITDNILGDVCATQKQTSTATISIPAPLTLDVSLWMQGRPQVSAHPRGSSGPVNIFARKEGETAKLWEASDVAVGTDGKKGGVGLSGLSVGQAYEFLLKGYIHLQVKKPFTLAASGNSLDFGTLLTGDLRSPADNMVNSLDNDILLTGWQQTWNAPQRCDGASQTYADCKPADFNLDSKVNSIDHDYIFSNWGKRGNE